METKIVTQEESLTHHEYAGKSQSRAGTFESGSSEQSCRGHSGFARITRSIFPGIAAVVALKAMPHA